MNFPVEKMATVLEEWSVLDGLGIGNLNSRVITIVGAQLVVEIDKLHQKTIVRSQYKILSFNDRT